jgi:uncharacterized membrane protein
MCRPPASNLAGTLSVSASSGSSVDEVEVSTVVYLPPAEVYEFLVDFPRYARYSKYLTEVRADGDGEPGTRYALTFSWWKLEYTAHSEVTDTDPPTQIDWELVRDLEAKGYWRVEEVSDAAPEDVETASRVTLRVEFDPSTASVGRLKIPSFVSLSWVIDKVKPLIQEEAERVVERIVADLEGRSRDVELTIHTTPDTV